MAKPLHVSLRIRSIIKEVMQTFFESILWGGLLAEGVGYEASRKPSFASRTLPLIVGACLITCCIVVPSTGTVGDKVRAFWKSVGVWLPWNQWQGFQSGNALLLSGSGEWQWWLWKRGCVPAPLPRAVQSSPPGWGSLEYLHPCVALTCSFLPHHVR